MLSSSGERSKQNTTSKSMIMLRYKDGNVRRNIFFTNSSTSLSHLHAFKKQMVKPIEQKYILEMKVFTKRITAEDIIDRRFGILVYLLLTQEIFHQMLLYFPHFQSSPWLKNNKLDFYCKTKRWVGWLRLISHCRLSTYV